MIALHRGFFADY